jgi:hypothetical protein
MKGWKGAAATAALVTGLVAAPPAHAGNWEDAGWGTLTVLTNFVYMPVKLVYATLGGVTGGLALALTAGDFDTAEKVWVTTMGGTYVLTPGMLQGQDPIAFAGNTAPPAATADTQPATADTQPATADTRPVDEQPLGGS